MPQDSLTPLSSALPPHLTREVSSPQFSTPSSSRPVSISSSVDLDLPPPSTPLSQLSDDQPEGETAEGEIAGPMGDEARVMLRGQLIRSLSRGTVVRSGKGKERASDSQTLLSPPQQTEWTSVDETIPSSYPARKYFVLTNAGKPVYASETDETELNTIVGVIQALISIFLEDDSSDKLRTIVKGDTKIVFVLRQPLYYACVSSWGEPESVLRVHLEYLHMQVLSIVTGSQLSRIFNARGNFDLRRLLEGTDSFFTSLIDTLQSDFGFLTHSLQPLRIPPNLRETAGQALQTASKTKDLLYALILTSPDLHILTLLRPTKHSIHPTDLHLLLNLIRSSPALRHPDNESWLPVCLPKYDQGGFVYVYVRFGEDGLGFVGVGKGKDGFEEMRDRRIAVLNKLEENNSLINLSRSIPLHPYSVGDLGIPGLLHFMYKSCVNVQLTQPRWEAPYDDPLDQQRLAIHYQTAHDALHARSCPGAEPLTLVYIRTKKECVLGWFTQPFELYLALPPTVPKSTCVSVANKVARWIKKEERSLFLYNTPVF